MKELRVYQGRRNLSRERGRKEEEKEEDEGEKVPTVDGRTYNESFTRPGGTLNSGGHHARGGSKAQICRKAVARLLEIVLTSCHARREFFAPK